MNVFDFQDYKVWTNSWIRTQSRGGHGQLRKLAGHLRVNSVVMSQVFRGDRDLTPEQAVSVSQFMGLPELERDYYLLLVQRSRTSDFELKKVLDRQLAGMRLAAAALKNRIKHQVFSDEDRATFYSHWYYSAIRLGASIPALNSVAAIADHLQLDRKVVGNVLEFLLRHKLIVEQNGRFELGPQVTHVGHDSPFVFRHHTNWRVKALQAMENPRPGDLSYTGPMALSDKAAAEIRELLVGVIEKATKTASASPSESLHSLVLDWFAVGKR